ncbi:MAG: FkbM family methyltransferase [Patescibacteria group bacterium]
MKRILRTIKIPFDFFLALTFGDFIRFLKILIRQFSKILRSKNLSSLFSEMDKSAWNFRVFGKRIIAEKDTIGYAYEIYARNVYCRLPGFLIKEGNVVLDLGASFGAFSILAAKLGAEKVIAVETNYPRTKIFQKNVATNSCFETIQLLHGFVGDTLGFDSNDPENSNLSLSLNDIIKKEKIEQIDFLKVDVDGSEENLFLYNNQFLKITKLISMEIHCDRVDYLKIQRALKENGFEVFLVDLDGRIVPKLVGSTAYVYARK